MVGKDENVFLTLIGIFRGPSWFYFSQLTLSSLAPEIISIKWGYLNLATSKKCPWEQESSATSSVQSVHLRGWWVLAHLTGCRLFILDVASSESERCFPLDSVCVREQHGGQRHGQPFLWGGWALSSSWLPFPAVVNCLHLFSRLMNQLQIMLQWTMSCKGKRPVCLGNCWGTCSMMVGF